MTGRAILPMHGRSHGLGSSDPAPQVTYLIASQSTSQGVTTTVELDWTGADMRTNDYRDENNPAGTFGFDVSDPDGILIYRHGLYAFLAETAVTSSDIAKQRSMYVRWSRLSSGVSFGNPIRPQIGDGQGGYGVNEVTGVASKTSLYHFAVGHTQAFTSGSLDTNPVRAGVALVHVSANDYAIAGTAPASALIIVRLGDLYSQAVVTS